MAQDTYAVLGLALALWFSATYGRALIRVARSTLPGPVLTSDLLGGDLGDRRGLIQGPKASLVPIPQLDIQLTGAL